MAGIEKVCEFSGDYPSGHMYGYKRNHIQIMPQYRKEFRGKQAILYIQTDESFSGKYVISYRKYGYHLTTSEYKDRIISISGKQYDTFADGYGAWHPITVAKEFWYALVVPDLPGTVDGIYSNYSCKISTVKRKLKRMLRCKTLEIRYIDDINNIKNLL